MDISSLTPAKKSLVMQHQQQYSASFSASRQNQTSLLLANADKASGASSSLLQATSSQSLAVQVSVSASSTGSAAADAADAAHQPLFKRFEQLLQDAYARISGGTFVAPSPASAQAKSAIAAYGAHEPLTAEKAAGNILGFIERRLLQDVVEGASVEQLQARLDAGLQGFKKGFAEAEEQLKALATLTPQLQSDITDTYDRVIKGVDDLRLRFLQALMPGEAPQAQPSSPTQTP